MSYFDTYGPYEIGRREGSITSKQREFWNSIRDVAAGLPSSVGCYIFCLKHGNSIRPWYVGMTVAKGGFQGEIFQQHKLSIYKSCLKKKRGKPVIFFFPLMTDAKYRFSRAGKSKLKEIRLLETTLMGFAHRRNPDISNVRDMKFLKNVEVRGLIGKRRGRPLYDAQAVKSALLG